MEYVFNVHNSKYISMTPRFINIILIKSGLIILTLLTGCQGDMETDYHESEKLPQRIEPATIELKKTFVLNNDKDQLKSLYGGIRPNVDAEKLYGVDFASFRPFFMDLKTSSATFLNERGSGPQELFRPVQVTIKNKNELFIYDNGLNHIAHFKDGEIIKKKDGYLRESVADRRPYGLYWNNHIVSTIEDLSPVAALEFDKIKPILIYNIDSTEMRKAGSYSPTADRLDHTYKWAHIALDKKRDLIYYVFETDYTVMAYNLNSDETFVAATLKPENFRVKTIASEKRDIPVTRDVMIKLGLDRTHVQGIDIIDDKLIVVWGNGLEAYYQSRSGRVAANMEIFGIIYDLPDFNHALTVTLPSIYLGVYDNYIMLEENDDILDYTIGFYELR